MNEPTKTTMDVVIPQLYAAAALKRMGVEPTQANIDKHLADVAAYWEKRSKMDCGECGRPHDD